jgi:rubrerythrin
MATTVGTESTPDKLIENCLLLEHDAIAAYDTVIERLENPAYKAQIESFRNDHLQHVEKLHGFASQHGVTPPGEGDMKEMLTTGKIKLADVFGGDGAILKAMSTNESDTVSAYSQAASNTSLPAEMRGMVEQALSDEKRHKEWMERTAQAS